MPWKELSWLLSRKRERIPAAELLARLPDGVPMAELLPLVEDMLWHGTEAKRKLEVGAAVLQMQTLPRRVLSEAD